VEAGSEDTSVIDILRKTRDRSPLSRAEIEYLVSGYVTGQISDAQAAAWLMAVTLNGLSITETAHLTEAMLRCGPTIDLSSFRPRKVDKHSTGGVGYKTSLIIAPIAAAGGLIVPMISGHSLGHTIGTLDKLEAIAGFRTDLTMHEICATLTKTGCVIVGANREMAPADRKFYALRDHTATVESVSLICASIMSKKLAEGIDGLVLEVTTGRGALMRSEAEALQLAEFMVHVGRAMSVHTVALIIDADQPLGNFVGTGLEVMEAIWTLSGEGPQDVTQLCVELAGWMFVAGGIVDSIGAGCEFAQHLLESRKALAKFRELVIAQGGDVRMIDDPGRLPSAAGRLDVLSVTDGYVTSIASERVGQAARILLTDRACTGEPMTDPTTGIALCKKVGDRVTAGEKLYTIHWNSDGNLSNAKRVLSDCYEIADRPPPARPSLIRSRIV
jgi:pyrimidine-nucleoside phosphorylase